MWKSFFKDMEKRAFGIGSVAMPAIMGALTVSDVSNQLKTQKQKMTLPPPEQMGQYQLGSPNQYQFEGGKHTDLKETTMPNRSMY